MLFYPVMWLSKSDMRVDMKLSQVFYIYDTLDPSKLTIMYIFAVLAKPDSV